LNLEIDSLQSALSGVSNINIAEPNTDVIEYTINNKFFDKYFTEYISIYKADPKLSKMWDEKY